MALTRKRKTKLAELGGRMPSKINYKEYLAGLGKVETSQHIVIIKQYLEKQCQVDEALKSLYRPEKIDDCWNFITEAVKAMPRQGNTVCVEDAVVFKMARDFYLEILPKLAETPPEVSKACEDCKAETPDDAELENENSTAEAETDCDASPENENLQNDTEAETEPTKADNENSSVMSNQAEEQGGLKTDEYGFEVFGETENDAQSCGAVETKAETEPEKADNENEGSSNPREAEPKEAASEPVHYDKNGNGLLFDFE